MPKLYCSIILIILQIIIIILIFIILQMEVHLFVQYPRLSDELCATAHRRRETLDSSSDEQMNASSRLTNIPNSIKGGPYTLFNVRYAERAQVHMYISTHLRSEKPPNGNKTAEVNTPSHLLFNIACTTLKDFK